MKIELPSYDKNNFGINKIIVFYNSHLPILALNRIWKDGVFPDSISTRIYLEEESARTANRIMVCSAMFMMMMMTLSTSNLCVRIQSWQTLKKDWFAKRKSFISTWLKRRNLIHVGQNAWQSILGRHKLTFFNMWLTLSLHCKQANEIWDVLDSLI